MKKGTTLDDGVSQFSFVVLFEINYNNESSYEHKQNEVFSADDIIQIQSENPVYNATLQIVLFFLVVQMNLTKSYIPSETAMEQLIVKFKLCVLK